MNQDDGLLDEAGEELETPVEVSPSAEIPQPILEGGSLTLDVGSSELQDEELPTSTAAAPVVIAPQVDEPVANEDVTPVVPARRKVLSGGWTMGLVLAGVAIIAGCILIPQGDQTRKLMYEREKLRADLEQVDKQVATNDEFLKKVQTDPTLAERLAQRQMKLVPAGTKVLDLDGASPTKNDQSPFLIVSVPPPAAMPPYVARGGWFSEKCRDGRSQLYMMGGGLMLVAAGLVLGVSGQRN